LAGRCSGLLAASIFLDVLNIFLFFLTIFGNRRMKGVVAMKRTLAGLLAVGALGGGAAVALASSTPIGPLPAGPAASIDVQRGELVALALPQRSAGRVWRVARPFDARVLRQVSEANVGSSVVLVFSARSAGQTTVSVALTKGDSSPKALEARRFRVHVR
jgi:hypothetical protein